MRASHAGLAVALAAAVAAGAASAGPAEDPPPLPRSVSRDVAPRAGSVRVTSHTPDAAGAAWAVRTWRARRGMLGTCLQAGRVADGRLGRQLGPGRFVDLRFGDRTVCGPRRPSSLTLDFPPYVVERLVDDPRAEDPRPVRTVVAGLAPAGARRLELLVGESRRPLAVDARTGTYLAVLDGAVRRRDLQVRATMPGGRSRVLDLRIESRQREGNEPGVTPGSTAIAAVEPDPAGGRPYGLLTYRTGRKPCVESGRVVAGEVGDYEPYWGAFVERPIAGLGGHRYSSKQIDVGPLEACPGYFDDEPIADVIARRDRPGWVAISGRVQPGVSDLTVESEALTRRPVALHGPDRAFLVVVPTDLRIGSAAVLRARRPGGRAVASRIALGRQLEEVSLRSWDVVAGGRRLRVAWGNSGSVSFGDIRLRRTRRRLIVSIRDLYPPDFSAEGYRIALDADLRIYCAEVRLPGPLGRRRVVDGATGRARGRDAEVELYFETGRLRCPRRRASVLPP